MSLSTSSFRKTEWKVVITVLLVLAVWEMYARSIGPGLDYDREHIYTFRERIKVFSEGPSPRVLFLGNSLTRAGVNLEIVRDQMEREGIQRELTLDKLQPVGTNILDWLYLYKTYFVEVGVKPDVVVLGFAIDHLPDRPLKRGRRLGRHFLSAGNIFELFREDVSNFGDQAEILLSYGLSSYGDQAIHQEELLYMLLPGYTDATDRMNKMLKGVHEEGLSGRDDSDVPESPDTFGRLERLLKVFRQEGTHAIVVAMPQPSPWDLSSRLEEVIRDAGMTFVDARSMEGITDAEFEDGYHLNEAGKEIYSRRIADVLKEYLSRVGD